MRELNASDFKARCLSLIDEVAMTGEEILIRKRGKPVARLVAAVRDDGGYPQDELKGSVHIVGDIIAPALSPDDWESNRPT